MVIWLAGGFNHLQKISQWEGRHPIYEMENKNHVWHHQPDELLTIINHD